MRECGFQLADAADDDESRPAAHLQPPDRNNSRGLLSRTFQLNLTRLCHDRVTPTYLSHRKCLR